MNKKGLLLLSVLTLGISTAACSNDEEQTEQDTVNVTDSEQVQQSTTADIQLGDDFTVTGDGVEIDNNIVRITKAGTYEISGTLDDGQIIVAAGDEDNVEIILNGANLTSLTSAPIYVENAKNTYIVLADGTENVITDAQTYVLEDETVNEPNAAIFSKDDLIIEGTGSLTVNGNYNNGIQSKDDLKIKSGTITITAANDGLKGKDSVTIEDGVINIVASGDGIRSTNDTDEGRGYITIEGGEINVTADLDAIQAETDLTITGGVFTLSSGGGSVNSSTTSSTWGQWGQPSSTTQSSTTETQDSTSAKGLKAGNDITIEGGTFVLDTSDDSIHTNNSIIINGGNFELSSGDDGIHADTTLVINGGDINILKSYEGIESQDITINDGTIHLVASDDGINAGGGNDGSGLSGRPGQNTFNTSSSSSSIITINGGYIVVDASGDGLDSNGNIVMTDGTVIVNGPTNSGNGSLDYDGNFTQSGGILVAAGSAGMVQTTSTSSTQNGVSITLTQSQQANTLVHIESSSGEDVLTFAPSKSFQNIIVSSPNLKTGSTYTVSTGGSSTGTEADGIYTSGTYSGGSQVGSFTISSTVSYVGSSGGNMAPGGMGRP
ncbi:MAG TPA: dockerin type 1 [Firmicutes bacterium]|nr:dockerin type 1 [Bacillota bacterium]